MCVRKGKERASKRERGESVCLCVRRGKERVSVCVWRDRRERGSRWMKTKTEGGLRMKLIKL